MAAIEYGSYYWCVILNSVNREGPEQSVHLHSDTVEVDSNGTLLFKSAGRRPAGGEPKQNNSNEKGSEKNAQGGEDEKSPKEEKDGKGGEKGDMIYMAFAAGTWRVFYAAKLQDGSPASVEHWNSANGKPDLSSPAPQNSGATDYPARV